MSFLHGVLSLAQAIGSGPKTFMNNIPDECCSDELTVLCSSVYAGQVRDTNIEYDVTYINTLNDRH